MNSPKKVFYIMLGVLGAVIIAGGGIFYYMDTKLSAKASEISNLKADDEVLEQQVRKGREVEQQLSDLQFIAPIIGEVLPNDKQQSNLVAELIAIETLAGVTLDSLSFLGSDIADGADPTITQTETLKEIGSVSILPVSTSFKCASFEQLVKFLEGTEDNRRKMQVSSIDINRINKAGTDCPKVGNLDVNLTIEVYVNNET